MEPLDEIGAPLSLLSSRRAELGLLRCADQPAWAGLTGWLEWPWERWVEASMSAAAARTRTAAWRRWRSPRAALLAVAVAAADAIGSLMGSWGRRRMYGQSVVA